MLLLAALLCPHPAARAGGSEVVVVYAAQDPDSQEVARYYATRRGVPPDHLIGLDIPAGANISRDAYTLTIQQPLIAELQRRRLMEFEVTPGRSRGRSTEPPRYHCTASSVRYLLLAYGLPYKIDPAPTLNESIPTDTPPQQTRNEASVDSELALLPRLGQHPFWGWIQNPAFSATNAALLHPTNGVFLVSRLDGPDKQVAKGLVDKALVAEATGLLGNAYFDLRGIVNGPYRNGDQWLTNMAQVARFLGFTTHVDNRPDTLAATFPMSHVALYGGWYTANIDGPFNQPSVEFMPGAIAYHIHSFSAANLRSADSGWTGPLLARGATVSMGSVHEPYLDLTPNPGIFLALLGQFKLTVGEAGIAAQPFLSWMNVVVGDPLYRPFARHFLELEQLFVQTADPRLVWPLVSKVNFHLLSGRDASILRQYLIEMPLSTNSAVLSEKLASMYAERGLFSQAVEWADHALTLPASPQQRTRILLNLSGWQETLGRHEPALATLQRVEQERPLFRDHLGFRETQHRLARLAGNTTELERLAAEIHRLTPPPPDPPPTPAPNP